MEIGSVGLTGTTTKVTDASSSLSETFDTFLSLLTTQLQNQDPLDPMDTDQFTQQLVNFSEVEQSIATNQKLDDLIELQTTNQLTAAVSYMGKTVEVVTDQVMLEDGAATIAYDLESNAAQTTISIFDGTGSLVRTLSGKTVEGRHEFVWDGRDSSGNDLPKDVYGFTINATDIDEAAVDVATASIGRVTGVEIVDDTLTLNIGDLSVSSDNIFAVREDTGKI